MADETHDTPTLSDERLVEIRRRLLNHIDTWYGPHSFLREDIPLLLAEVDRLRAREAAAMAIVREVANAPDAYSHEAGNHCTFCHASSDDPPYDGVHHTPDCPVTKARALLAEE
jgi:hypothetical protein